MNNPTQSNPINCNFNLKMPLRDLFGSPSSSYSPDDPRHPKNYYKLMHERRMADEAAQDRRVAEAYRTGKLTPPEQRRKVPGLISHNDALYFVDRSGWTHAERWRPSKEDEAERLRRAGHGTARETGVGSGGEDSLSPEQDEAAKRQERKKSVGEKVKGFIFGAAGVTKE